MLTPSQAHAALDELLRAAAGVGEAAAEEGRLAEMAPEDLVRLDDHARTGWSPWASVPARHAAGRQRTVLLAAVQSMHPDGWTRQAATRFLAGGPGRLQAALLALRCVDHVPQVREDAALGLAVHTSVPEAMHALPVLLAVARRRHGPAALSAYTDALLARHGPHVLVDLLDADHRGTRRWAFRACLARDLLAAADLLRAAQDPDDQVIRRSAADHLAGRHVGADPAPLRQLLTGRYADGRVAGLVALTDGDLSDGDLRAALLDRSPRVRDTARWRARRRGMDVVGIYRAALEVAAEPRTAVAGLTGLMWVGDRSDLPAIESRLYDPSSSVRVAAVQALIGRTEPGEAADRLGPLLLDPSPRVATTAARALGLCDGAATREAESSAWASAQPWSRRAAWRLARTRGGWERVEADLRAAADPELSELGHTSLREWLRNSAATTWNRPAGPQAQRVASLLPAAGLDEDSTRLVAFHTGVRPGPYSRPAARSADPEPDDAAPRSKWWRRFRSR